ncbi:hypothetical protein Krad_1518 [Kineococcus radiotolerans SRS30216 = ATCC BAA-149]|uniref:Uncharacterized protein n=1 Tax=Kineococcus radiotolerans (strain ATCC BAA-149 / DSM 14245 / SRS30216) TaxID=266940 RepID=A6W867_KINRD|nr:hypothetical protein Krad_1518 [Kineococcus radiotolerans SRS30216 = ATCC BAA-149]
MTTRGTDVPDEKSAQEHLEASQELTAEAKQGWQDLPESEEADDAGVRGQQGHPAPAD